MTLKFLKKIKGLCILFVLLFVQGTVQSQSDTLFTKEKKIICKIIEINETEIKYKLDPGSEGPLYVTSKKNLTKFVLSNGFEDVVMLDTARIRVKPQVVTGNRSAVKLQVSHLFVGCISAGYEKVLRMGINLELEAGLNNNTFHGNETLKSFGTYSDIGAPVGYCVYFKPGVKILLGKDFSKRRIKYANPLKGRYLRFDMAVSYVKLKGLFRFNGYETYGSPAPTKIVTDVSSIAFGGLISYGRQFLISKSFTFDYYFGLGYTIQTNMYSNPDFVFHHPNGYDYDDRAKSISRYGGFTRDRWFGYTITSGLKLGYIIPSKKMVKLPKKAIQTDMQN